jgi:hypothetical protein
LWAVFFFISFVSFLLPTCAYTKFIIIRVAALFAPRRIGFFVSVNGETYENEEKTIEGDSMLANHQIK